jgi:hypothetical protein
MNALEKIDDKLDRIFFQIRSMRRAAAESIQQSNGSNPNGKKRMTARILSAGPANASTATRSARWSRLTRQIAELKAAKSAVISGAPTAKETPEPSRPTALPLPTPLETKGHLKNRLDEIDELPRGDELKAIVEETSGFALNRINNMMTNFRSAAGAKQGVAVSYSEGEHISVRMTLAALWVETRKLFKVARIKRENEIKRIDLNARANRALTDDLLKRVTALETRMPKYMGTWNAETEYHEANTVTHNGSSWHCWRTTRQQPGTGADWQLQVKKGKDAR